MAKIAEMAQDIHIHLFVVGGSWDCRAVEVATESGEDVIGQCFMPTFVNNPGVLQRLCGRQAFIGIRTDEAGDEILRFFGDMIPILGLKTESPFTYG